MTTLALEDILDGLTQRVAKRMRELGVQVLTPACGLERHEACPVTRNPDDEEFGLGTCECPCHPKPREGA